jgi:hypothetical protein
MQRSNILLLALAFCLLTSFTSRAGNSYAPMYEEEYHHEEEEHSYTGQTSYTGNTSYTGHEEEEYHYEEEEEYYHEEEYHYEEEEENYYEEEEASYTYTHNSTYEEEYEEEEYNYNSGSYGGKNSSSYGQGNTSSGYGSSPGYTGSYDSSKPSSTPKFPTSLLTGFVVDIHFLAVDIHFQYIAYHYCSDLFSGFTQCAIYNGTGSNSRLIATEQIVSAEIFATLPLAERKLYHSHAYSVKNGLLVLPGLSPEEELKAMAGVMNTYGKVVDYWHSYQDFPLGPPRLAYGLAADNQLNTTIIEEMDKALNLGTTWLERKKARAGLKMPTIIEGANDYLTSGKYPQYVIKEFDVPSD